ncbi:MAG: hypothetical protein HC935_08330 [Pseudanabaena sp. SU_2_4]|nr:hypothetical protein [Pseudanabaena sp. SU_2_4]
MVVPRVIPCKSSGFEPKACRILGLFEAIHPDDLTPNRLMNAVLDQVDVNNNHLPPVARLDLNALCRISDHLLDLVYFAPASTLSMKIGSEVGESNLLELVS